MRARKDAGILYSVGMGVAHDDVEAYFWLSLASARPARRRRASR